VSVAWITGATGAWGRAFGRALLDSAFDVVALGRRDAPELAARAIELERRWAFAPFDLADPPSVDDVLAALPEGLRVTPDVLVHAAISTDGDRVAMAMADYLAPAALVDDVARRMGERGGGRIGVLVGQNGRLGLAGLGDISAPQGALWTWCEARREILERDAPGVSLTVVIPPRTASGTQRFLAERSGRTASLAPPDAAPLLRAILAGRRRAGRRPLLAGLATAFR
jgi:NAD(P)-dependent dehydrogenase (short-subunit alcohol dehydrogenase family)